MTRLLPALVLFVGCAETPADPVASFASSESLTEQGWTDMDVPRPPPVGAVQLAHAAMVGAPIDLQVSSLPAGVDVMLIGSKEGPGVGPCHPGTGVCVDILSPRLLASDVTDGSGRASFAVQTNAAAWLSFQVVVAAPAGAGATGVLEVPVADVEATWSYDELVVEVENGESGYAFGMAETFAGPVGWYGEDCLPGNMCHVVAGSLLLTSVHPGVGGPGLGFVVPDVTTLFYDIHGPYITYFVEGLDSGDCFTWGDDPSYYPDCTALD